MKRALPPIKIGLTGSIGMGKSAVSRQFRALGFRVFDADEAVHRLYAPRGRAGPLLGPYFPSAIMPDGSVDRQELHSIILSTPSALKSLESLVHPLVTADRETFFDQASADGCLAVVYDIPLLLENRVKHHVDYVIVVTASANTQRQRVLARNKMTIEKFESILANQMPDSEKLKLADFIINTDYSGFVQARSQVAQFIDLMVDQHHAAFDAWKTRTPTFSSGGDAGHGGRGTCDAHTNSCDIIGSGHEHAEDDSSASGGTGTNKGSLKDMFDMIVFDFDDTLTPVMGPVMAANHALERFVNSHMPKSATSIRDHFMTTATRVKTFQPLVAHDYTEMRRVAMLELCGDNHEEALLVDEAIQVFTTARSDVEDHLYGDVMPCLQHISSQGVTLALFTNGNAIIPAAAATATAAAAAAGHAIPSSAPPASQLSALLSWSLNAGDVGAKKPSMVPFIALSQLSGVVPSRILHVGDNHEHDVVAAQRANYHAAHLKRPKSIKKYHNGEQVAHNVGEKHARELNESKSGDMTSCGAIELSSLQLDEFTTKLAAYVNQYQR